MRSTRQIKYQGGELARLQSQARSLEKLIAELRKALENRVPVAKQAPFEALRGKLPWPVQPGKVLARFGQPRAGGSLNWQGMLVGTDRGARVRAPFAGRVVYADWLPGMGLMIVLDHGEGYMSLYGHNEELFRKVGEPVAAGDVIASVGDSGGHNQPALYFEVRRGRDTRQPGELAAAALTGVMCKCRRFQRIWSRGIAGSGQSAARVKVRGTDQPPMSK